MKGYNFRLSGKIAIVTGASRGIGKAIAIGFAERGAKVVLASRSIEDLENTAAEIRQNGGTSIVFKTDVSDQEAVSTLIENTLDHYDGIDILVNNAGVSPVVTRAERLTGEDLNNILSINLAGAFFCTQEVGKVMIKQERGCIVNITSICSRRPLPGLVGYCAGKAGLGAITKTLALEWAKYNIRVNAIGPGYIETDMNKAIREAKGRLYQEAISRIPMKRFGKCEEVVGAAIFLSSDEASYMTGQTLFVDGGWIL